MKFYEFGGRGEAEMEGLGTGGGGQDWAVDKVGKGNVRTDSQVLSFNNWLQGEVVY